MTTTSAKIEAGSAAAAGSTDALCGHGPEAGTIQGLPFPEMHPLRGLEGPVTELVQTGRLFYHRGWSVGTSSNYSVIVDRQPLELLVTASGMHKGRLRADDFVRIDQQGRPIIPDQPKSSAETLLHVVAAQALPDVGAVLHTHSIWATILSDHFFAQGHVPIAGYEMLKGLGGITTHQIDYRLPIFENTQNIPELADRVAEWMGECDPPGPHGYLIRKHGLYTWGRDVTEAQRHVEILEFLLECVGRQLSLA